MKMRNHLEEPRTLSIDFDKVCFNRVVNVDAQKHTNTVYDLKVKNSPNYQTEIGTVHNGGGKRKGSFAMYLEPWHADLETFLDIKKNHGAEEMRARDLFPALWIPDAFMKAVENDTVWYLSCPNEQLKAGFTRLDDIYGEEFNEEYLKIANAIDEGKMPGRKVSAQDLWKKILTSQIETGTPYMLYKDAANEKSNQKNLGTIKSSNLCTEIIEYSSPDEQAVCNLASINLTNCLVLQENGNYIFDFDKLNRVTFMATTNLNKVIDENSYPTRETEISNLNHRPIGLGVQGLADVFALLKIPFYSPQAKMVNIQIFEEIYYAALKASNELARVHGPYSSFEGSPASKGILQYDMWGVEPINKDRFDHLKESIKTIGLYNSLLVAPMPTASTAQIMGNNEAFEPFKSNMYVRRVLAGEFNVVNKHLVGELEKLGLWNEQMKADIMYGGGSVQDIKSIPQELRDVYKTSYEMSMKDIIQMAADRGAFIDQSQSMNLFVTDPTIGKISSMHMYSWKKGLKTGMYYLRSKNKVTANKGLGLEAIHNPKPADPPQSDDFDCIGCGS